MASGTPSTTVIAVRGEASRTVAPDAAQLHVRVSGRGDTQAEARADADTAVAAVVAPLEAAGGTVLTAGSEKAPITWSVGQVWTYELDPSERRHRPGRFECGAVLAVRVRELALLAAVESAVTAVDAADVQGVAWTVDEDNPAWALVRADAITAALQRGRDYATALGAEIVALDEVADAGLGSDVHLRVDEAEHAVAAAKRWDGGDDGTLDPVPQRVAAVVEARLRAAGATLPGRDG